MNWPEFLLVIGVFLTVVGGTYAVANYDKVNKEIGVGGSYAPRLKWQARAWAAMFWLGVLLLASGAGLNE